MVKGGGVCDTRCQLFTNECTRKENSLRMKWFMRNRQRLLDNLGSRKLVGKAKAMMAEHEEHRRRQYEEAAESRHVNRKLPDWRPPNPDGTVNLDTMRPVDPNIRAILYEKGVESYIAADNYLYKRYKDKPEDRYCYPDSTGWTYGWRLKDYPPIPASKFGNASIVQATFYHRNASSLQRDPDWYRLCRTGNPKNFDEILTY